MSEKIQKVLAQRGLGSRREIERWIADGRIAVNGKTASVGDRICATDKVSLDGRSVRLRGKADRARVLLYNKPVGEICTRHDPEGRKNVFQALPPLATGRWIAVGRLDINTSGLLLFTNEGELANRLMHPSQQIERQYLVRVHGGVDEAMLDRLLTGVELDDGPARFDRIESGVRTGAHQWFSVTLTEGRQREVRRLWESQGVEVSRLKRIRFGSVEVPSYVRSGEWLELEPKEVAQLGRLVALSLRTPALTPEEKRSAGRQKTRLQARGRTSTRNVGRPERQRSSGKSSRQKPHDARR